MGRLSYRLNIWRPNLENMVQYANHQILNAQGTQDHEYDGYSGRYIDIPTGFDSCFETAKFHPTVLYKSVTSRSLIYYRASGSLQKYSGVNALHNIPALFYSNSPKRLAMNDKVPYFTLFSTHTGMDERYWLRIRAKRALLAVRPPSKRHTAP